jgi:hypothetical protein
MLCATYQRLPQSQKLAPAYEAGASCCCRISGGQEFHGRDLHRGGAMMPLIVPSGMTRSLR